VKYWQSKHHSSSLCDHLLRAVIVIVIVIVIMIMIIVNVVIVIVVTD